MKTLLTLLFGVLFAMERDGEQALGKHDGEQALGKHRRRRLVEIWKEDDPRLINCDEIYKKGDKDEVFTAFTVQQIQKRNKNLRRLYVGVSVNGEPEVCTPMAQLCQKPLTCKNWAECKKAFNKYFTYDKKWKNQRIEGMTITIKENTDDENTKTVNLEYGWDENKALIAKICQSWNTNRHKLITKVELKIETNTEVVVILPDNEEIYDQEICPKIIEVYKSFDSATEMRNKVRDMLQEKMAITIKEMHFTVEQESSILDMSIIPDLRRIKWRCEEPNEYGQLTLELITQISTKRQVDEDEQVKIKDETKNKVKDHQEL